MLCMTEKILNRSVKHVLRVSPNTLLFGDTIPTEQSLMAEIDRIPTSTTPRIIRDYVDKLMDPQSRLIVAAVKSQHQINADNLNKRYSTHEHPRYGNSVNVQELSRFGYTELAPGLPQHRNG